MALPRRFLKTSAFVLRIFFLVGSFFLVGLPAGAADESAWIRPLWGEHLDALEKRGVKVAAYREKTLRLALMISPNDGAVMGALMQFHAQRNSALAPIIAQHLLTLKEVSVDQNVLDAARSERSKWNEALKRKSDSSSTYAEFTWPKIELALKQGQHLKAEQLLLDMLYDYPRNEKALRFLAQLYLFNHEWRLADTVYEVLQAQGYEDVEILNNRTLLHMHMVGLEGGRGRLEALETRYPNEAAIIQNRAVLAEAMDDREHALLLAGRWAQIDRKNPEALTYYGQKLLDAQSWIFARDAFTRAIRARPQGNDLKAMWGLAQAEAGLGEYSKCTLILQDIKELSSSESFLLDLNRLPIPDEIRDLFTPKDVE